MNLPCRFSEDSQTIRSGSHGKSELFVTKVDPLDYAMSRKSLGWNNSGKSFSRSLDQLCFE
jgi:hypothetical protein